MLDVLCKLLGIREDQAEDALKSEQCARLTLSRRSLFSAALCTGAAFSFGAPADLAEAYEVRLLSYPMLMCQRPGKSLILDTGLIFAESMRVLEVNFREGTLTLG